jgi:hypothetical protein
MSAGGRAIGRQRDPEDMFAFHLEVSRRSEEQRLLQDLRADYYEGEKYPHLKRDAARPDVSQILKP